MVRPAPLNPFGVVEIVLRSILPGHGAGDGVPNGGPDGGRVAYPSRYDRAEAAERAGLTPEELGLLWRALGFPELPDGSRGLTDADVDAFREVAGVAREGLVDVDEVVRMVRPMGHLVSRLGAAQVSALTELVAAERAASTRLATGAAADRIVPLLERLVVHAWRRHLTAAASAAVPVSRLDDEGGQRAVGFVDIASYTALSRRIDWADLAALLDRFEACVFDRVAASGGRVVKTLGDEVLFVAAEPAPAAEIALAVADAVRSDGEAPPVHAGLAYGPLLERAGDVFGPTVNLASRITGLAHAGTVLADPAFVQALGADPRFRAQRRPRRPVRGYAALTTYRLRRAEAGDREGYRRAG